MNVEGEPAWLDLDAEALTAFLAALDLEYRREIGPERSLSLSERIDAASLLAELSEQGEWRVDGPAPDRYIRPLLVRSPREGRLFDELAARLGGIGKVKPRSALLAPAPAPTVSVGEFVSTQGQRIATRLKRYEWIALAAAVVTMLAGAATVIASILPIIRTLRAPGEIEAALSSFERARDWLESNLVPAGAIVALVVFTALIIAQRGRRVGAALRPSELPVNKEAQAYRLDVSRRIGIAPDWTRKLAARLGKRQRVATSDLDAEATVNATLSNGLAFSPRFRSQMRAVDTLVLIARRSGGDLEHDRIARMSEALSESGLSSHCYAYWPDPREAYVQSAEGVSERRWTLRQLAELHPDARLVLASDGSDLIDGYSGKPHAWTSEFVSWERRALLTPRSLDEMRPTAPLLMQRLGFALGNSNARGLEALPDLLRIDAETHGPAPVSIAEHAEGLPTFAHNESEALSEAAPSEREIATLLAELEFYLGRSGLVWLTAIAAAGDPTFENALFFGFQLRAPDGSLIYTETLLSKLTRLPWLRHGWFPRWLRQRLMNALRGPERRVVKRALIDLLYEKCPVDRAPAPVTRLHDWRPMAQGRGASVLGDPRARARANPTTAAFIQRGSLAPVMALFERNAIAESLARPFQGLLFRVGVQALMALGLTIMLLGAALVFEITLPFAAAAVLAGLVLVLWSGREANPGLKSQPTSPARRRYRALDLPPPPASIRGDHFIICFAQSPAGARSAVTRLAAELADAAPRPGGVARQILHYYRAASVDTIVGYDVSLNERARLLEAYRALCLEAKNGDTVSIFAEAHSAGTAIELAKVLSTVGLVSSAHLDKAPDAIRVGRGTRRESDVALRFTAAFGQQAASASSSPSVAASPSLNVQFVGLFHPIALSGMGSDVKLSEVAAYSVEAAGLDRARSGDRPEAWPRGVSKRLWFLGGVKDVCGWGDPAFAASAIEWVMARARDHNIAFDTNLRELWRLAVNAEPPPLRVGSRLFSSPMLKGFVAQYPDLEMAELKTHFHPSVARLLELRGAELPRAFASYAPVLHAWARTENLAPPPAETDDNARSVMAEPKCIVICFDDLWRDGPSHSATIASAASAGETRQLVIMPSARLAEASLGPVLLGGLRSLYESRKEVIRAYASLCASYSPGDKIYVFASGLGAYHASRLTAIVSWAGILPRRYCDRATAMASYFLAGKFDESSRLTRDAWNEESITRRDVDYVGLFDAITPPSGALMLRALLGSPELPGELPIKAGGGRHALAIDEKRSLLTHALCNPPAGSPSNSDQPISEQWFIGDHSDLTVRYDEPNGAFALMWVAEGAREAGLQLDLDRLMGSHDLHKAIPARANPAPPLRSRVIWWDDKAPTREDALRVLNESVIERMVRFSIGHTLYRSAPVLPFLPALGLSRGDDDEPVLE